MVRRIRRSRAVKKPSVFDVCNKPCSASEIEADLAEINSCVSKINEFARIESPEPYITFYDHTAPLKLTIRTVQKSSRKVPSASQTIRPPLKLTLPKPATYPYSTNVLEDSQDSSPAKNSESNAILSENIDKFSRRPWSSLGDQKYPKSKVEGELKIRLPKQPLSSKIKDSEGTKGLSVLRLKLESKNPGHSANNESVYDFHDESDDDKMVIRDQDDADDEDEDDNEDRLMIDEKPKRRMNKISPFRMKMTHLMAVSSEGPKNGIDELLKASGYTVGDSSDPNIRLDDIEYFDNRSVQASPSTKEAIAGMLSMSMAAIGDTNSSTDESSTKSRKRLHFSDDYGENIDKVHQDDDYIYPTLDASDDEDMIFKPRGRRKLDEAWSPKARVGPLVPKTDRPTREGTKKQSVEKGLEAAAAKRAGLPAPKRPYNRKKVRQNTADMMASSSSNSTLTSSDSPPQKKLLRRPRKGMATPKQRLGKILKIHKMKF